MTERKIKEVVAKFAEEAKRLYGTKLQGIILYGSCARGNSHVFCRKWRLFSILRDIKSCLPA